jgi:uncharacterized delta-60 repeat protein
LFFHLFSTLPIMTQTIETVGVPGRLDPSFNAAIDGVIHSILTQPDGTMLIGGGIYQTVNGVNRNGIAKLHSDGSVDTNFVSADAAASRFVRSIALQPDGKVLIGGRFLYPAIGTPDTYDTYCVARLNTDGSLDQKFKSIFQGSVSSLLLQPDGKIVIFGDFLSDLGDRKDAVARLNPDFTRDSTFRTVVTDQKFGDDRALAAQADGKLVIGGYFDLVNNLPHSRLARIKSNGSIDTGFNTGVFNGGVDAMTIQRDGKILVGGYFSTLRSGQPNAIARFEPNGGLDFGFAPGMIDGFVSAIAVQTDGRILIGGNFRSVDHVPRNRLARLNANGSLDLSFERGRGSSFEGGARWVYSVAIQSDGKILVGGDFEFVDGVRRVGMALLNDQFRLTVVSEPGRSYVVQASYDLIGWTSLGTNTPPGNNFDFVESDFPNLKQRFYRVRQAGP